MKYNIQQLESTLKLPRIDFAGALLILTSLNPGDKITTNIGTIEKLEDGKFNITCDEATVRDAIEEWTSESRSRPIIG